MPYEWSSNGGDWTKNDLQAYNIRVSPQSLEQFYGRALSTLENLSDIDSHLRPTISSYSIQSQQVTTQTRRR
jgi:hypothetical protein